MASSVETDDGFRSMFEALGIGIAKLDCKTGRILEANRKYCELMGYTVDELKQRDWMTLTHPDDLAADLAAMRRLREGEIREFSLEKRLIRSDGSVVWVHLAVSALWPAGTLPTHHVAAIKDITEAKLFAAKLEQATADLESTLTALPDLMFETDDEGTIWDFRAPDPRLLAAPPSQFMQQSVYKILPEDVGVIVRRAIDETLAVGQSRGHTYRLVLPTGPRYFELSMARKTAAGAGRPRLVAIARDVTERVESEARRESLEAQLRQSQKMEAVGQLAGGVAHDFNNLLSAIRLNLELARSELPASHPAMISLDAIAKSARRATDLVQQILAFSRKQPVRKVEVELPPLVDEAVRLLRTTVPPAIRIEVSTMPEIPRVLADPTQIVQVLLNLGTNAWHALKGGHGTISIRVDCEHQAGGRFARLAVSDDGIGISPELAERIFEPFFTTKAVGEGSGLGLSVVHGIVHEHHGAIRVRSEPGRGSTFEIVVPEAPAPDRTSPPLEPAAIPHRLRVFYVDDDEMVMNATVELLGRLGHQATGFTSPRAAYQAFLAAPDAIDIVITDLNMPEGSGLELARDLHRSRPGLPIVLVSGFLTPTTAELRAAGIASRLDKPFESAELAAAIAELVR